MTHPAVDNLPARASATLLSVCEQLSQSRHPGLARWASSVSDALLVRLASMALGRRVDVKDFEPCGPLAQLDDAELEGLRTVVLAGADASDDESVVDWCIRMNKLIVADLYRRDYEQAAVDAKVAAIDAEERRLTAVARTRPQVRCVPSRSEH